MVTIKKYLNIIIFSFVSFNLYAEGSFELRGGTNANDEVRVEGSADGTATPTIVGLPRTTIFYVDILNSQNEVLDLYTSNPDRSNTNIDIAVWCPNNIPANPEGANVSGSANEVFDVRRNGQRQGFINSWADVVSVQTLTNRNRDPVTFDPQANGCGDGVYAVRFYTHATNGSRTFDNGLAWMDIGVRDVPANVLRKGRVFSRNYSLIQNGFNPSLNFQLYSVEGQDNGNSYEGYVWEIDANGIQPFGFQLFSNSIGISPDQYNDDSVFFNANPAPFLIPEYNIYLNYPAKTVTLPPAQPDVTNFFYNNICPDDNDPSGFTTGGYFNFYSNGVWKYKLYIDLDNNGSVDLNEKVFQGTASAGLNRVYWDGILPDGSTVPNGTNLRFNLYLSDGEVHFPFLDVENNIFNSGPIFTLVNTTTPDSGLYYWNDIDIGGTTTGIEGSLTPHVWDSGLGNNAMVDTYKYAYNDGLQKNVIYGGECTDPELGGNVSGFVFDDLNHNGSKDANEPGIEDVTIVLHNITNNDCETQKTDANGSFLFDNILVSTFNLVESATETLPISFSCPPNEEDPAGYISVDPNTKPVVFNELNASYITFANYKGYRIQGKTYLDNGLGSNLAHNGIQDGSEEDLKDIRIDAFSSGSLIDSQVSQGDGTFDFWIRDTFITVDLISEGKLNFQNVSSDVGTTLGSKTGNNEINISGLANGFYSGVSFGYIQEPSITGSQTQTIEAGSTTVFTHKYRINSIGQTSFSIINENKTPNDLNANSLLYIDQNCNGVIDNGIDTTNVTNVSANINSNNEICLVIKVFTPLSAVNNSTYVFDINAETNYLNIPVVLNNKTTDLTVITDASSNSSLVLTKSVDRATALPNELITYTVKAKNNGSDIVDNIIINDFTPNFTNFNSASCPLVVNYPSGITNCVVSQSPSVGNKGNVQWTFTGILNTNDELIVVYEVRVDN